MKTVTLTPDYIEFRSNKKSVKFKISHDRAIELLMKWEMPMHTWRLFDTLDNEDKQWITKECTRVLTDRNKTNELILLELVDSTPPATAEKDK